MLAQHHETERNARETHSRRALILVVEDDGDIALLIRRILTRAKYQVEIAHTGRDALRLARDRRPQVITLDLALPDMSGLDLLDSLSRADETRDVPVVIVSVSGDEHVPPDLRVAASLQKPFNSRQLLIAVQQALGGQRDG